MSGFGVKIVTFNSMLLVRFETVALVTMYITMFWNDENGGRRFLHNVSTNLPNYMVLHPRRIAYHLILLMIEQYLTLKGCLVIIPSLNVTEDTPAMLVSPRLAVIGFYVAAVSCAIDCTEDHCSTADCVVAAESNAPPCGPDQRVSDEGTLCGCCRICVTQLGSITTNTLTTQDFRFSRRRSFMLKSSGLCRIVVW